MFAFQRLIRHTSIEAKKCAQIDSVWVNKAIYRNLTSKSCRDRYRASVSAALFGSRDGDNYWVNLPRFASTAADTSPRKSLLEHTPAEFVKYLGEHNIRRCFLVYDQHTGKPKVSHPQLQELADYFNKDEIDYREHEGVFMMLGARTNALLGAFVWRTCRGQACGGIRLWQYESMDRYIRDGLRLAIGMGTKSALAGLWAGGGKGVVAEPEDGSHLNPQYRQRLFYDYGEFLTSLNGCYVAAEDVGLTVSDLDNVHARTRYTTCINADLGGSGNPSIATGKGVVCGMEAALEYSGRGTLEDKSVAIQGAGNVAVVIIEELLNKNVRHIYVTDVHQKRIEDVTDMFSSQVGRKLVFEKVPLDDTKVLSRPCHIVSPCALGNILNKETIPKIQANIVCGAANNQLSTTEDADLFKQKGIIYVPDFLCNRMGIVNCANEAYGRLPDDPAIERHFTRDWENSVFVLTKEILKNAERNDISTAAAAFNMAETMSREMHPIWPHRGQQIINQLIETEWHKGKDFWM